MIRILTLFFILTTVNQTISGQKNEIYVKNQLKNIEKLLSKGEFKKGLIYINNDTIEIQLFSFAGKRKINYFLFCIAKTKDGSTRIFKPSEIDGYQLLNTKYISHRKKGNSFFIKQIKTGRIDLYERNTIPDDDRFLYYLKFPNTNTYHVVNPNKNSITAHKSPHIRDSESTAASIIYYENTGIDEKFKYFIATNLSDCYKVTNMVKSDFYTINDTPSIIETYNNCF